MRGETFVLPSLCCSCLAPAETTITARGQSRAGGTTTIHTLEVPACRACAGQQGLRMLFRFGLTAGVATAGWFALRVLLPGAEVVGVLLGLVLGSLIVGVLRLVHPDPASMDVNGRPRFLNAEYARLFKEANASDSARSRRSETVDLWIAAMDAEKGRGSVAPTAPCPTRP